MSKYSTLGPYHSITLSYFVSLLYLYLSYVSWQFYVSEIKETNINNSTIILIYYMKKIAMELANIIEHTQIIYCKYFEDKPEAEYNMLYLSYNPFIYHINISICTV